MGILCSKSINGEKVDIDGDLCVLSRVIPSKQTDLGVVSKHSSQEKQLCDLEDLQPEGHYKNSHHNIRRESDLDDYYDGIPRIPMPLSHKSRSRSSTQAAVAKV